MDTATAPERAAATPQTQALRIGVFGGFGIGNFGNDASLEAALDFLRAERPEAEVSVICTKPDVVEATYGVAAIPTTVRPEGLARKLDTLLLRQPSAWSNWVRCLAALKRYDVMLVAGTGVFDDFRDTPWGWPSRLLRWCLAARMRGVRIAYLSVGGGPILNPVSRFLMKRAAQLAQHRSYRDENSRQYMLGIGVDDAESVVLPDLAFLLPKPPAPPRAPDGALTIGVGTMTYRGWRDNDTVYESYLAAQQRFIEWAEAQGHKVRILIGQTPADLRAVDDLEARMGRALVSAEDRAMNSIHDVMRAVAETDVVIASRYHVQVAALKQGKPVMSLSYAPKNDALLEQAGLGAFVHDIHAIDFDKLVGQFSELIEGRETYAEIVRGRVGEMEARLRRSIRDLNVLGDAV